MFATTGAKSVAASSSALSGKTTFVASEPESIGSLATFSYISASSSSKFDFSTSAATSLFIAIIAEPMRFWMSPSIP